MAILTDAQASNVREELERLVAGPLGSAPQLGRFLRFVVEETLAGRSDQLKEHTVAVIGLGRATFDPATDASVRVAARQLRFKLAEHYRQAGSEAVVVIDLPKGGYVPVFRWPATSSPTDRIRQTTDEPVDRAPLGSRSRAITAGTALVAVAALAIVLLAPDVVREDPAPVVAVLPFENLTGSPDDVVLGDGLSDEITSALARDTASRVIARTSAWAFRDRNVDVREIGRQLSATHVVEGAVRRAGSRYRVTVQVNSAIDGQRVWAEQYEVDRTGAFGLYDQIAQSVHLAITSRVAGTGGLAPRRAPSDPAVHEMLVEGRYFWNQRTDSSMHRAARLLTRATETDSLFAPAWAALAGVYATMEVNHITAPGRSAGLARASAERSLRLDPSIGEAWAAIGLLRGFHEWRWAAADSAFQRAIVLAPNYATARSWYSNVLLARGDVDGALVQLERASRLDPLSMPVSYGVAQAHYYGRRWSDGLLAIERTLHLSPGFHWANLLKAKLLKGAGRTAEARALFAELADSVELALLDEPRRTAEIPRLMAKLTPDERNRSQFWIATNYAQIGWPDSAFAWLERAYSARQSDLSSILVDPMIDPVKTDPRYRHLVERLSLSPVPTAAANR